ncbi:very long chain fatty acid elongase 7 [Anabrus simplex]|uniref:very long chain fatty acid elongase 7 n=1 Tax=Anabrus simplex TaxID=316456 RepID=UPI0034DD01FE
MDALERIHRGYEVIFNELSDPRSTDWFPVSTPVYAIGTLVIYVKFAKDWGPKLMKDREPFDLRRFIVVYNISQILLNAWLFCKGLSWVLRHEYSLWCEPMQYTYSPRELEVVTLTRYYFLLKVYDLLDTVFFVLRKKQNHVSFVHVYHHSGMFLTTWMAVKFLPGGHGFFLAFMNTVVHTIMYTYYLLTSISPEYGKYIWWKKHLTQLQMTQFLLNFIHMALPLVWTDCDYPKWGLWIICPQNIIIFLLFADFYKKTYIDKSHKKGL